jgi:hypothetical protein
MPKLVVGVTIEREPARSWGIFINQANYFGAFFQICPQHPGLTLRTKKEQCSLYVPEEKAMFRTFIEEAAALASIVLFVAMIAVWAQLIPQL